MEVEIEPEKCIASGQCVLIAEQVFDQDDDGIVRLHSGEVQEAVPDDATPAVRSAAQVCPARAIHLRVPAG